MKERIKTVFNYKKTLFRVIAAAVAACAVAALCFEAPSKSGEAATEPFDRNYSVEAIVYSAPQFNFSYTQQTAPEYRLTADRQLMIMESTGSDKWLNAGTFAQVNLAPSVFEDYFMVIDGISGWRDEGMNAEKLRLSTQKAWRLDASGGDPGNVFYLLLQHENGEVYLTYGYDNGENQADAESSSLIRWVFKLKSTAATQSV